MSTTTTPDEEPKAKRGKKLITEKRKYFLPDHNVTVEAEDSVEAEAELNKLKKTQASNDGE